MNDWFPYRSVVSASHYITFKISHRPTSDGLYFQLSDRFDLINYLTIIELLVWMMGNIVFIFYVHL